MSKRTTKYDMTYFEQGDSTSSVFEMQRWETLDAQLRSMFEVLGNGVLEGWGLLPSSGLSLVVSAGKGHVNFVATETTNSTTLAVSSSTRSYIYASLTESSYWDKSVNLNAFTTQNFAAVEDYLYLGYVDADADSITTVNIDGRTYLGFVDLIQTLISEHRHIGGTGNPQPVNLATDVQGILKQESLPDLDASMIQSGIIDSERLPQIDHITKLINQGTLTHAQLDSFVEALDIDNATLMGETSTIDLLQLILALKHVYPDIDEFLVNEIAYVPGISPNDYVDWENTTATVDTKTWADGGQHTITGAAAPGRNSYTKTWDREVEFNNSTNNNVIIDGDNVCLETQRITLDFDDFNNITTWEVITKDLSGVSSNISLDPTEYVVPPTSGKLNIGGQEVEIALDMLKTFSAMDWSEYDYITFYLKTENVEHGDVFFYLNDAFDGPQNSYTKVLERNTPTINVDTLQDGWQEITVDISSYTRDNINKIGFFVSTQYGWDTSKGFDFNIDQISLSGGNKFKEDGYLRVIYGNSNFLYEFWRVRWDIILPTDAQSAGVVYKVRTRVGNTLADLDQATWSSYTTTSGSTIPLPLSGLYNYIEVESYFGSSDDYTRTACLRKLYLDFYAGDVDSSFTYDSKDDWDSGDTFNVDLLTVPNSMLIAKTEEVNDIFYGSNGNTVQLDDDLTELYRITGTLLPKSTYQAINDLAPSLGLVTGVSRGDQGDIWASDIDNDRVIEFDKSGAIVRAFYGSFLTPPTDNYGIEERGPGSNYIVATDDVTTTTTSSTTTLLVGETLEVLQVIYNSGEGVLYVVFSSDLENIYASDNTLDMNRIYLKIGTQRFYLNDSIVELLGVPETEYDNWVYLTTLGEDVENAKFIDQFNFKSHVLKVTLQGADKVLLNAMVNELAPSIVISTPDEQETVEASVTVKFLLYNFELGSQTGENGIRVTLDGSSVQDVYADNISFNGLSNGVHTIKAQLLKADGSLNTNVEAIAEGSFIVSSSGALTVPYIYITAPKINQIYSASPIVVEFDISNFSVIPTGQHLRYVVDSDPAVDYYSYDPITIEDLEAGAHTIKIYMVDKWGADLGYTYGSVTVNFIVGLNSNAVTKLYIDPQAIYDSNASITTAYVRQDVDVGNIYFANIYSPVDIQVIPVETSKVNLSGLPTILVSKLRSQSWLDGLGDQTAVTEFASRVSSSVDTTTDVDVATTTTTTTLIATPALIFGTNYLDGHSIVQMDMEANTVFSNNAAIFAKTKDDAKTLLGSGQKLGDSELLIADPYNKRAIITYTNLTNEVPLIEWEYDSDRYISDFHIILQEEVVVGIRDDAIDNSDVFIRQGTTVIWENNSASPVSIYSGTTTYTLFQLDPDLNLYGDVFKSPVLQPGERFAYKFVSVGEVDWFIYPGILTGKVTVTKNRISSMDKFVILESDGLDSPFSSRVLKVDAWGNISWSFGESYLVKPRDARPLLNNGVIIST